MSFTFNNSYGNGNSNKNSTIEGSSNSQNKLNFLDATTVENSDTTISPKHYSNIDHQSFTSIENTLPKIAYKNKDSQNTNSRLRNYSLSEAFNYNNNSNNPNNNNSNFDIGGRSYVSMSYRPSVIANMYSPQINTGNEVHEQTANLANIGVVEDSNSDENSPVDDESNYNIQEENQNIDHSISKPTTIQNRRQSSNTFSSTTPLLSTSPDNYYTNNKPNDNVWKTKYDEESSIQGYAKSSSSTIPEKETQPSKLHQLIFKPLQYLPGVFLGTLLNILDGLSYGMIMFPISDNIFAALAPAGLAMFYVSCIVSQLVYSLGGSAFKAGIGSEMIEVTPFFHTMALAISKQMKNEGDDAIIATTITSYAVSSIITGLVFFLLGKLKLGVLVGFFPRHILVGCIGGVGYFLVATGIEVSSRLEGGLFYNYETFKYLFFNYITFLEWTIPLILALILVILQHKIHNSLLVPMYFILVFIIFHLIVLLVPNLNLNIAREWGWVFPAVEDDQPWYSFYELYKFKLVDWFCIVKQLPTMLALTFFGILHVPINVPALAVSIGMDDIDVDRELVAHGYSNAISGLVGSIQNYLVYTNSVLFIRAGADDRGAGVLLAIATGVVMMAGPVVIGYIPVCVVGALIYLLGYELLKESVWDTWGRLRPIEYTTIIIIVVTMGAVDFVAGIGIGILLACLSFVVEAGRTPVVQGIYSGNVARSTVLRHPKQQEFLKNVGEQICIIKLQGTIFFGSIGGVEKEVRNIFEHDKFRSQPIKYLIIDMKGVISIDFSAAEGFRRILNLTNEFKTQLIISSVVDEDDTIKGLRDAGLFDNNDPPIELFSSLNYALEWCENSFLKTYKTLKKHHPIDSHHQHTSSRSVPGTNNKDKAQIQSPTSFGNKIFSQFGLDFGTPRTKQVFQAASKTVLDEQKTQIKYHQTSNDSFKKQPLPLMMITFQGLSSKDEEFWSILAPYFIKEQIPENLQFYDTLNDEPSFFIVESGLIRAVVKFETEGRELHCSIVPLVAFGDLDDASQYRQLTYTTVNDSIVWKLTQAKLKEMLKKSGSKGEAIYHELLEIEAKLIRERFDTMTANLIISG
ncbi:uncharacterized protein KGF55_000244 [Candida pseudojiufengensis]|uniref:uncharacterized protein n=1 Tax=Candida pseudojiufengensis TaxID=497109 RepID=UPI0022251AC3|nr:uncharacterized protein KGF55_000244 [Candida pseudojiufengensis]KAI5966835.1 hypothetical protein KGF55_000244 [Candida pseudojiufengensis]